MYTSVWHMRSSQWQLLILSPYGHNNASWNKNRIKILEQPAASSLYVVKWLLHPENYTLKMEKAFSSKIFVPIYQWTQQCSWEDCKVNANHCENLKSHTGHFKVWGHPHVIPSPSPIQSRFTSQLSFFCLYTNQHADLVNSSLTKQAKPLSHSLLLCLPPQTKKTAPCKRDYLQEAQSISSVNQPMTEQVDHQWPE